MSIALWNTTPFLALYCHLNDPAASTVLLPESDNCRACTPATHRPNNRACTPTISQPTGRQALYLTTITTAAGTVLLPERTFAALLPFYSAISIKKNCQKLLMELSEVDDGTRAYYLRHSVDPDFN